MINPAVVSDNYKDQMVHFKIDHILEYSQITMNIKRQYMICSNTYLNKTVNQKSVNMIRQI
jgi:uncharacterized protein YgiM (DUF1202 family)